MDKKRVFKIIKRTLIISLLVIVGLIGAGIGLIQVLARDLPDVKQLEHYEPSLPTKLYDCNGKLISQFYIEQRYLVPLNDIPPQLIDATLAIEDKRFYQHWGLDPIRIVKAIWVNITSLSIKEGASTLTQQLARNLFLTYEKTFSRKIKEMILAVQIEQRYTKEEILQFYFNQIHYGHGAYGAEAAARVYFDKHVGELTLDECAILAAIPKNYSLYSPFINPEKSKERRDLVLHLMREQNKITEEEYQEAVSEEIDVFYEKRVDKAPYFTEYVRRQLEREFGSSAVYRGGLEVYTTLDLDMQESAEKWVKWGLEKANDKFNKKPKPFDENLTFNEVKNQMIVTGKVVMMDKSQVRLDMGGGISGYLDISPQNWTFDFEPEEKISVGKEIPVKIISMNSDKKTMRVIYEEYPYVQGSLLCVDYHTGEIKAMVGGYDFDESSFNRAYQSKRQPGSSFKIFVYTAAFDNGFTPADIIMDAPFAIEGPGLRWKPHNYSYSYSGPMTIRKAVEKSINIVAAKIIDMVGIETVMDYAYRMGIKSELVPVYSLSLGSSDVTLLDMVTGVSTLANYGVRIDPYSIKYILDRNGNKIKETIPYQEEVLEEGTCSVMIDVLQGAVESGTAALTKNYGYNGVAAGKTGTTNRAADAWYVGFTSELICGVWVGMDDHSSIGYNATGATEAVPIWAKFMKEVVGDEYPEGFESRGDVVSATICQDSGLLATEKCKNVRVESFVGGTEPTEYCDMHEPEDIFSIGSERLDGVESLH
jgi:penicillin-binding protein 1A